MVLAIGKCQQVTQVSELAKYKFVWA